MTMPAGVRDCPGVGPPPARAPVHGAADAPLRAGPGRRRPPLALWVVLVAALAGAAWAPFVTKPLSADEGGFLMVAAQWRPGSSLYGDYWVDRPPLLIGLFQLAGGRTELRLVGIAAVLTSVALAGRVGHLTTRGSRSGTLAAAATAAIFLSTPYFGVTEVDGEVLAVPFVLAGLVAAFSACSARSARASGGWWLAAGALGACAALVKQNMLDVFVAVAALGLWQVVERRHRAALRTCLTLVGATAVGATTVVWAQARGTRPGALWDALVTFRIEAAAVIQSASPSSTAARAETLLISVATSGALFLMLLLVFSLADQHWRVGLDVRLVAVALACWETVGIAFGGSYWLHYLLGAVPGLVVAVCCLAALGHKWLRLVGLALGYAAVMAVAALVWTRVAQPGWHDDAAVDSYLHAHVRAGDTGVVAFGDPSILQDAGLSSPYEHLWSLPVRVRDPRLSELTSVLAGPGRPTWVIVSGTSLDTWGVDAQAGQRVLDRRYRPVAAPGTTTVYLVRTARR